MRGKLEGDDDTRAKKKMSFDEKNSISQLAGVYLYFQKTYIMENIIGGGEPNRERSGSSCL